MAYKASQLYQWGGDMPSSSFAERCEHLFSERLGYGRRWKSAAAHALKIGRASLYRYLKPGAEAPDAIWAELIALEGGASRKRSDNDMLSLIARALCDVQAEIDRHGWLKDGYPQTLQRVFDIASAQRALGDDDRWPTDLPGLTTLALKPLYEWGIDMSWDPEGDFTASRLIHDGETTPDCADLAAPGRAPEDEITEQAGYSQLMDICRARHDGQAIYVAFRRGVILNPVLSSWTETLTSAPMLASESNIDALVSSFYQPIPESFAINGQLPLCKVTGTLLRRQRSGFHTESRDPAAINAARSGERDTRPWRPGAMQLKRPFRRYWCLPGRAELELAGALDAAGWTSELWPKLDMVDIAAASPDGARKIAVDVKDYLSPYALAKRFDGFKGYTTSHDCYLVVADYVLAASSNYARRFNTLRAADTSSPVKLRTVSSLLKELGI